MVKKLIIPLIIVLVIIIVLAVSSDGYSLSPHQEDLVDNFGYPTSYVLAFGEMAVDDEYKPVRFETWNYDKHGRSFYFVDGVFKKDSDIDFASDVKPFLITPDQFEQGLSFDEIKNIVKADPTASGAVPGYIVENTTLYNFSDQINVGVENGEVVYIKTLPITSR